MKTILEIILYAAFGLAFCIVWGNTNALVAIGVSCMIAARELQLVLRGG
jgi:hypothetical protein